MPIYEYRCDCSEEVQERLLPRQECDQPQICKCGKVLQRKMSVFGFAFKPTGRGMALDTLNSKSGGMPNSPNKAKAQHLAGAGL